MMASLYDLSNPARDTWKKWLKAELARASSSQQGLAIEVFGLRDNGKPSNTTEVNRFVAGDEEILRRWFELLPERAQAVAEEIGIPVEDLRAKLDAIGGHGQAASPWHDAFPTVTLEEALIPSPLDGRRGSTPEEVARDFANKLQSPDQWKPDTLFCDRLELTAPPGSSRRIAAEQLRVAVRQALEVRAELAREHARKSNKEIEPPSVDVIVAEPDADHVPRRVVVVVKDPPSEQQLFRDPLRLGEWGPDQAVALARQLSKAPSLDPREREALRDFAALLEHNPGWTPPVLEPDLLIRWLAEVARSAPPKNAAEARGLMTAAAWRRAQRAAAPLAEFGEEFLDLFFARLANRERRPGELGPWTRAPRDTVLGLTAEAMNASLEGFTRSELLDLVDALSRPGRGGSQRRAALRQAIAAPSPSVVVDALIQGGVLKNAHGGTLVAAEPELAAAHAARALKSARLFHDHPELLVDPHGAWLVDELARHGGSWRSFAKATAQAPDYLSVDVAVARLRFAWCADAAVPPADLTKAWASVLWASAHGLYAREPHGQLDQWTRTVQALLKQVSWRFRESLPLLGPDPIEDLRPLVPSEVIEIVSRWRRTPGEGEPERQPDDMAVVGLGMAPFRKREDLANTIRALAPSQLHPARCWERIPWRKTRVSPTTRLQEVALSGDEDAIDVLTGRAWLREEEQEGKLIAMPTQQQRRERPAAECWLSLPAHIRLAWVLRHGPRGDEGWKVYRSLLAGFRRPEGRGRELELDRSHAHFDDLAQMGAALGTKLVERAVAETLIPGRPGRTGWFPVELAWELAERLGLRELLDRLVAWPGDVVPQLRLEVAEHAILLSWGVPNRMEHLKPVWSSSVPRNEASPPLRIRPRLGLESVFAQWRSTAMRAAGVLHRLGHEGPLVALWEAGHVAVLTDELRLQAAALEGLLAVLENPRMWARDDMPVEALAALTPQNEDCQEGDEDRAMFHILLRTLGLQSGKALSYTRAPWVLPEIRRAFRGLWALVRTPLLAWPPECAEWLRGAGRMEPIFLYGGEGHHLRSSQSEAAARLLLEGGDERPLRLWAEGKHVYLHNAEQPYEGGDRPPVLVEAAERAVRDWWKSDPLRLDRLWDLVEEQVHARQGVREQLRWTLLLQGSLRDGWKDDAPTRPGCPRPYVIRAAINDLEIADRLDPYNWPSPRWAAVVRYHHDQAPDARSRAQWAARLARVEPACDEVLAAVKHWMLEDPTPWTGPLDFEGPDDHGRFTGGAPRLLELAPATDESWVADGLERIWRDGLTRPWLGYSGHEKPEAMDGWWYDSSSFGRTPLIVRTLVDALIDRGREAVVVEAWPGPPDNPKGDDSERPLKLRSWLEKVVPKLAPDALLQERVDAWLDDPGTRPFPRPEAWELFQRGRSDMQPAAYALAEKLVWPQFAMLARTNPSKLLLVGQQRTAGGLDPLYVLWLMVAEMTAQGGEAPREVMATREMLLDLGPLGG